MPIAVAQDGHGVAGAGAVEVIFPNSPESTSPPKHPTRKGPLKVGVVFTQNDKPIVLTDKGEQRKDTIRLADTDAGEVPAVVTVEVTITNRSSKPVKNISMNGTPALSFAKVADATQQVPASVTGGPTPSGTIVTLAAGANAMVEYKLTITNNGAFVVTAQVLSSAQGSSGTAVAEGSATITAMPTALLYFSIDPSSIQTGLVTSGSTVTITGTVTNRSLTQSLDVTPFIPNIVGNAGEGDPEDTAATPQPDGYVPLVAGTLKPGASENFSAPIVTAVDGGTRATLTYDPEAKIIENDGTETPLTSSQIRIGGKVSTIRISIDDSAAPVDRNVVDAGDAFTKAFTAGAASWVLSSFNGVKDLIVNFPQIAGHAVVVTASGALATAQFLAGIELNVLFWTSMTDAQKQAFEQQIVSDVVSTSQKMSQFTTQMSDAIDAYFTRLQTDYQTGDWVALGTDAGEIAGKGLPEIGTALLTDAAFGAIGRLGAQQATNTISLARKLRDAEIVQSGLKTLAGLRGGDNLIAKGSNALESIYGIGKREAAQLQYWAEQRGLLISVRSRNPESLNWIEKFKAVVKPEILKIKNVDAIDVKFLGYLPQDAGSVVFAEPISMTEVLSRIKVASLSPAESNAVLARYADREEEWSKWYSTYEGYAKAGKVNIGFDVNAQGVVGPNQAVNRRFALDAVNSKSLVGYRPAGSQYFQVELGDASGGLGTLRRVTGDIDIVAITKANGEILSPSERAQLYIDLQGAVGMQHGETLSWLKNGDILFDLKAKLLAAHLPGGELLAVFGPDGSVRAATIYAGLTIFNETTKSVVLHLDGAFQAVKPVFSQYVTLSLGSIGLGLSSMNSVPTGQ